MTNPLASRRLNSLLGQLPLGLWLMSLVFDAMAKDVLAVFNRGWILHMEPWPEKCAFMCVAAGAVVALFGIATGMANWLKLAEEDPAQKAALGNMALNMLGTAAFIWNTGVRWRQINYLTPSTQAFTLSLVGFAMIAAGAYLGMRMVFRHGVGVRGAQSTVVAD